MLNAETLEYLNTNYNRYNTQIIKEYGKYTTREREAVYNDNQKCYKVKEKSPEAIEVHSARALVEYIKSEFARRNNPTGKNSSLQIDIDGGKFCADDDFSEGICHYDRIKSQQWETLEELNGSILNHEQFLLALLKLSPSITDFKKIYKSFLKLRIVGKSELVSNPVYINNEAESGYMVKYKLQSGQSADEVVPDSFIVKVPYIKASKQQYEIDVDVQVLNSGNNELRIKVNIPTLENVEENAIIDEVEGIKEKLTEHSEMLVLSDI